MIRRLPLAFLLAAGLSPLAGCGPAYVPGTEIVMTEEHQVLVDLVERYRVAVEQRDAQALRTLASTRYYENASTTNDPSDDYDYRGLEKVLSDLKGHVKELKYDIQITDIQFMAQGTAHVDYDFTSQYRFSVGEQDRWSTMTDKNRLTFRNENGQWRIISGM